jgi:hypothetical protein
MRRLDAMLRLSRNSVNRSNRVGNTLRSTALRTCTAVRKTMMLAVMDAASRMSSTKPGIGISMTKTMLMAAPGSNNA